MNEVMKPPLDGFSGLFEDTVGGRRFCNEPPDPRSEGEVFESSDMDNRRRRRIA